MGFPGSHEPGGCCVLFQHLILMVPDPVRVLAFGDWSCSMKRSYQEQELKPHPG